MPKQEPQQPQYAPQPDPNAQYGPAPQPQNTPYEQQPVSQQYFAQPQAAPVQYVVMAESLKGVKGWLMFFVVCFVIGSLVNTAVFFQAIMNLSQPENVISLIFSPVLVVLAICAVVFITMQKRLGKWLAVATIAHGWIGQCCKCGSYICIRKVRSRCFSIYYRNRYNANSRRIGNLVLLCFSPSQRNSCQLIPFCV